MNTINTMNWIDIAVLCVFFISILAGLVRGFVKEVISILTWIVAIFAACTFATPLATAFANSEQMHSVVANAANTLGTQPVSVVATGVSFIFIFIVVFLIGMVVNYFFSSAAALPGISFINRILGAAFGFVRGYIVVVLIMFLVQLSPMATQTWWTSSQFVNSFQPSVQWLGNWVQPGIASLKNSVGNVLQGTNPQQYLQGISNSIQGVVPSSR